jgi:hypothetical protein
MPAVRVPQEIFDRLVDRETDVDAMAGRAIAAWMNLTDARTVAGSAAVDLLDAVGSAARGDTRLPAASDLAHWLALVNRMLGSNVDND